MEKENSRVYYEVSLHSRRKNMRKQLMEEIVQENALLREKRQDNERRLKEAHDAMIEENLRKRELIWQKAEHNALKAEQKDAREIEALHLQTRREIRLATFNGISLCQEIFRDKYAAIIKLMAACQEQEALEHIRSTHNEKLKELIHRWEDVIGKLKKNEYGPPELLIAQQICETAENLEKVCVNELEQCKERVQESLRRLAAAAAAEESQRQEQQQQQQEVQADSQAALPTNVNALHVYDEVLRFYQEKVERVKPLKNDESARKYRFALQKAINIPINAIAAVSPQHLADKFEKLYGLINGQPVNDVRVTDHPLGRDFCLLLMAKKFVSQGATAISSNPQSAFAFASVLVSLWKLVPEIGQLFLAYLYKESPYMVPCFLTQKEGQSIEDYLKQLGYYFANGQVETGDMYLKRQAGVTRLYAAVIVSSGRQASAHLPHPHSLSNAWRWLTSMVSTDPLPDLSATLIMEFLQIVSAPMLNAYRKEYIKLLVYMQTIYFQQLARIDNGGPRARFELQLKKMLGEGRVEEPLGILPSGYW